MNYLFSSRRYSDLSLSLIGIITNIIGNYRGKLIDMISTATPHQSYRSAEKMISKILTIFNKLLLLYLSIICLKFYCR